MARIRSIKPEFWQDEKLAPLSPIDRLVFLGLISQADDAGRLIDNVKLIDGLLFPQTEDSSRDSIETLVSLGRITRYPGPSGQRLIQITNWKNHQKVDNPGSKILPAPFAEVVATNGHTDTEPKSRETLSRKSIPEVGCGKKENYSPEFVETRKAYPKRAGGDSEADAWKQYQARLRSGETSEAIHAGTLRYKAYIVATGKEGTEYVKQMRTFLGPSRHYLESWDIPGKSKNGAERQFQQRGYV